MSPPRKPSLRSVLPSRGKEPLGRPGEFLESMEPSSDISALYDGEAEAHELRAAVGRSLADAERWRLYGLIGDGLRGESLAAADLTDRVMMRVAEEPVVLAPRRLAAQHRQHPLLALAASVAGVAVVGWLVLTDGALQPGAEPTRASVPTQAQAIAVAVPPAPTDMPPHARDPGSQPPTGEMRGDLREYLLAHHAHASTVRLGDSAKQIRTVAMTSSAP